MARPPAAHAILRAKFVVKLAQAGRGFEKPPMRG